MPILPKEIDIYLGLTNKPAVEQEYGGVSTDTQLNAYVSSIGNKMAKVSEDPSYPYQFKVLNSEVINAFALPAGQIYINKGLLNLLKDESQIAGVLGHEIGHVTERHAIGGLEQSLGNEILIGGVSGILKKKEGKSLSQGEADSIAQIERGVFGLFSLGYSRSNEFEADSKGLKYMYKAGYNPLGMVGVMKVLQGMSGYENKLTEFFQTHPMTSTRLAEVEDEIKKKYPLALQMKTGAEELQKVTKKPFYENPTFRSIISVLPFVSLGLVTYFMLKPKKG